MGSLSNPCHRTALERRIQAGLRDRRLGTALAGYSLHLPDRGIAWGKVVGDTLAGLSPEDAVRLLMSQWGPAGWLACYIFEADGTLVWQARLRGEMVPGDYLTAADPVDLNEQIGQYPARRVSVPL